MKERVDTIIYGGHLFTMEGPGVGYLENGAVAIADGRFAEVGEKKDILRKYCAGETVDAGGKMILPGFIDAHIHTSQTMMRGMAQDTKNWMMSGIEPLRYYLDSVQCIAASKATVLEALAAGTTTFVEYAVPGHIRAMDEFYFGLGVRSIFSPLIYGMRKQKKPELDALYDLDDDASRQSMKESLQIREKWKKRSGRISVMLGVHAPDTLSLDMLKYCKKVAEAERMKINMHVAQGSRETQQMEKRYGLRSIPFLDGLGYLDENLIAVHLTDATDEETAYAAKKGVSMILCSGSIGIIDGIVPPAAVFQKAGGAVALGTDQASGNNCNQMINEMKLTALFNKIKYEDPEIMPAWKVLRMATCEGARALGMEREIGSVKTGKRADLIFIDLNAVTMLPVIETPYRNMVPNLVYAARGNEVCRVMVDGKTLFLDGEYLTADADKILTAFRREAENYYEKTAWGEEIKQSRGCLLQEKGML